MNFDTSKMQANLQNINDELAKTLQTGESGAGLVKVTMNGKRETVMVNIDPSLLNENLTVLEELMAAAINDATKKVETIAQEKLLKLTSGLGKLFDK